MLTIRDHQTGDLFDPWAHLGEKRRKLLDRSWAAVFREHLLKHLPVRYLKLDGEFIHNLPRSEIDAHMVRANVGVAQGMGIKTVAESVTDEETIRLLQQHGVDYAQGFHVGRPGPI